MRPFLNDFSSHLNGSFLDIATQIAAFETEHISLQHYKILGCAHLCLVGVWFNICDEDKEKYACIFYYFFNLHRYSYYSTCLFIRITFILVLSYSVVWDNLSCAMIM